MTDSEPLNKMDIVLPDPDFELFAQMGHIIMEFFRQMLQRYIFTVMQVYIVDNLPEERLA